MTALLVLFLAGLATFATPCLLPMIPIYLATLLGGTVHAASNPSSRKNLVIATTGFSFGFGLVFTLLGMSASFLGELIAGHRVALTLVSAVAIVLFGLHSLGIFTTSFMQREVRLRTPRRISGPVGGFFFGVVFALGWTPCAGPLLASALGYAATSQSALWAGLHLAAYSLGIATPLLLIATFADRAIPLLRRVAHKAILLQRATGAAMVVIGLVLGGQTILSVVNQPGANVATTTTGIRLEPVFGAPIERPRLIELVREECPVCKRMTAAIQSLDEECSKHDVDVVTIDLTHEDNKAFTQKINVVAVPTLLLVDKGGRVVHTLVGERSLTELRGLAASLQDANCSGVEAVDPSRLQSNATCQPRVDGQSDLSAPSCG
jgi:cytochrome c-type biogenesis protein